MLAYFFAWRGAAAPQPVRKGELDRAVEKYLQVGGGGDGRGWGGRRGAGRVYRQVMGHEGWWLRDDGRRAVLAYGACLLKGTPAWARVASGVLALSHWGSMVSPFTTLPWTVQCTPCGSAPACTQASPRPPLRRPRHTMPSHHLPRPSWTPPACTCAWASRCRTAWPS